MNYPKVLVVFSSSELGGAERSLTRMALTGKALDVFDIATLDGEGPWSDWCRSLGGTPIVFGRRHASHVHGRIGMIAFFRLLRLIRKKRYDAIYVIGLRASFYLRVFKLWLRGARLVHGVRWNPDSNTWLDRYFRLIERFMHPLVDAWIVNSRVAKETLHKRCGIPSKKIYVIYNGIKKVPDEVPAIEERPLEVLTVANLNPRKGHSEFLRVIHNVVRMVPDARFVFIGRDDMNCHLQHSIKECGLTKYVRYEGFQKDVSPWYRRARLFVLPSLWGEGCPTSILESQAHKLPVVAYAIDGIPELVESEVDGILVEPNDQEKLAAAIERILCDRGLAKRMGESGRLKVKKYFTLENCVERHIECFSDILLPHGYGE